MGLSLKPVVVAYNATVRACSSIGRADGFKVFAGCIVVKVRGV
jgi:hypothetical protein